MEHPPFQSDPSPPRSPHPSAGVSAAKQSTLWRWFIHLLQTRPVAFLSGVWVSMFLIAIVAVGSLLSPNAAERRSVSAIAIGSDSAVATQPLDTKGKVPVWLFGAIAITCTAGSILVSRQLSPSAVASRPISRSVRRKMAKQRVKALSMKPEVAHDATMRPVDMPPQPVPAMTIPSSSRRSTKKNAIPPKAKPRQQSRRSAKPVKRLQPYVPGEAILGAPQGAIASGPLPSMVSPPVPSVLETGGPQPALSYTLQTNAPSNRQRRTPLDLPVPVTVVPDDQPHALDWEERRLAEAMDVRRTRSLNSWQ